MIAGTVTFLLTDVEGSTDRWERAPDETAAELEQLERHVSDAVERHGGSVVKSRGEGDSAFAVFSRASDAAAAALDIQTAGAALRVRIGIHCGEAQPRDGDWYGPSVNRCARLRDAAHGGQVLLSAAAAAFVGEALPHDAFLVDHGAHRLRDLSRPEQVFELRHPKLTDTPPPRTLDESPNNLPVQLTTFVGRDAEIAVLRKLLPEQRMLTLTGPGGCGKTRLALHLAAEVVDDFAQGVFLVELASLADESLVASAIIAAIGAPEERGRDALDVLIARLHRSSALIVLDNCEHVVDGCASVASAILHAAAGVRLLATSREPLGVQGETTWPVPSLSAPPAECEETIDSLSQYEAVRLFVDRAMNARPNFAVTNENAPAVAEICHRLDGIPLAVELAAARTRSMTPQQICAGLSDRFRLLTSGPRTLQARQRTLRASVDWSHDLLSADERMLFRRLCAFAGSFELDAAEAVAADESLDALRVLDLLSSLVDRSLVVFDDAGRYRLTETLRQYAAERLGEAGEVEATRARHLRWWVSYVERIEPELERADQDAWRDRIDLVIDEIRTAFDAARDLGDAEAGLRLAAALCMYWPVRNPREGRDRGFAALDHGAQEDGVLRARAFVSAAYANMVSSAFDRAAFGEAAVALALEAGDEKTIGRAHNLCGWELTFVGPDAARPRFQRAVEIARRVGDEFCLADALEGLGSIAMTQGELAQAVRALEESIEVARRSGGKWIERVSMMGLGYCYTFLGRLPEAETILREGIERSRGDVSVEASALGGLSLCLTSRGAYDDAVRAGERAVEIARAGHMGAGGLAAALTVLGNALLGSGDAARAAALLREAETDAVEYNRVLLAAQLAEALLACGDTDGARATVDDPALADAVQSSAYARPWLELARARIALAQGRLQDAEDELYPALAWMITRGFVLTAIDALGVLGRILVARGRTPEAVRLLAASDALLAASGGVRPVPHRAAFDGVVATARGAIGTDQFDDAWREGSALAIEDAAAYAVRGRGERKRPSSGWDSLTPAESQVVTLVTDGLSNPEIAARLFVSRRTVTTHLTRIFAKLGLSSRSELAAAAARRGA